MKKGIIIAGGKGTRLMPLTKVVNKQLLPIYDKPMILYSIEMFRTMGVTDILIITGGNHVGGFVDLLGDGSDYGVTLTYKVQKEAKGIAQALSLAEDFVAKEEKFVVILGDNIYEYAPRVPAGCGIVVKAVEDPRRFGVYASGRIEEKPLVPRSRYAVTGLYFYTKEIFDFIRTLQPSARGELEITDVNNWCLENLEMEVINYEGFWSDAGTPLSLLETSNFIFRTQR